MSQLVHTPRPRTRSDGRRLLRRLLVALLGALAGLSLVPAAASAQDQVLTWTAGNPVDRYLSAPSTAVAGPATIIFDNSVAAGNTIGMPHTLTFDTSTPGYNHDVSLNIVANPFDAQGGRHEAQVTLTPGKYRYFCTIPGHGMMVGEFTVTGDNPDPDPDTTAPAVTATVTGDQDADGAYVGSATVTLAATDDGSGVDTVEYSLDGGDWTAYTAPVVVSTPGEHTVAYRATDVAGNTADGSVDFTVVAEDTPDPDTTAPEVTATVTGDQDADDNYVGSATVTLAAADADSGVAMVEYSLDGGEFTHYHMPVVVSEPGEHTVAYRATDVAGNTADGTVSFTVVAEDTPDPDTTAPTVTAAVAGSQDADGAYVGTATVTVSATDDGSGVDTVEYSLDGGDWTAYSTPLRVSAAGEHTVAYRATDVAGNTADGTVTFTVVEDTTEPGECSDTRATVVIGDVDTGVENVDTADGCLNDLIDEDGDHATHGAFVRHVGDVLRPLAADGVLTQRELGAVLRAAVRSEVGRQ